MVGRPSRGALSSRFVSVLEGRSGSSIESDLVPARRRVHSRKGGPFFRSRPLPLARVLVPRFDTLVGRLKRERTRGADGDPHRSSFRPPPFLSTFSSYAFSVAGG
jgi:hypothetical protein